MGKAGHTLDCHVTDDSTIIGKEPEYQKVIHCYALQIFSFCKYLPLWSIRHFLTKKMKKVLTFRDFNNRKNKDGSKQSKKKPQKNIHLEISAYDDKLLDLDSEVQMSLL